MLKFKPSQIPKLNDHSIMIVKYSGTWLSADVMEIVLRKTNHIKFRFNWFSDLKDKNIKI